MRRRPHSCAEQAFILAALAAALLILAIAILAATPILTLTTQAGP